MTFEMCFVWIYTSHPAGEWGFCRIERERSDIGRICHRIEAHRLLFRSVSEDASSEYDSVMPKCLIDALLIDVKRDGKWISMRRFFQNGRIVGAETFLVETDDASATKH